MRFDLLDEYSTLVPFALGVSERNRVVQHSGAAIKAVKPGAIANWIRRLKILFKIVKELGQIRGRKEYRKAH
jgi:hypothetical protein